MPPRDKSTTSSKQVRRKNAKEPNNGVEVMSDAKENRNGPSIAESKSARTQRKTQQPTLVIDMSKAVQWASLRNSPPSLSRLRSMPPLTKTEDILTRRRMFAARSINERRQIPFEPLPYLPQLEFLPQMQPSWALSVGFPHKDQISHQATLFSQNPRTRYDDDVRVRRSRNTIATRTRELQPLRLFTDAEIKCGLPLSVGFQLFPWLPAELRLIIWSMNLPGPRFVKVIEKNGFFTCAPIINLLVCAESRYEALKIYTFAFANGNAPPIIPFNFEKDVLFISPEIAGRATDFRNNCNPEDLAKVQRLAVQEPVDRSPTSPSYLSSYWPVDDLFGRFTENSSLKLILPGLKEFTLISEFLEDTKVCEGCIARLLARDRLDLSLWQDLSKHCTRTWSLNIGCEYLNEYCLRHNTILQNMLMAGPNDSETLRLCRAFDPSKCEAERYDHLFPNTDEVVQSWKMPRVTVLDPNNSSQLGSYQGYMAVKELKYAVFGIQSS